MKSFNGLYKKMLEPTEIELSIKEAAKGKMKRREVRYALEHVKEKALKVKATLESGSWNPPVHELHRLQEGSHKKERLIEKPRWNDEQIVHHMLMRQFTTLTIPRTYKYACGVVKGRGPLYAVRAIKRWRDGYGKKRFYVAELDIKKFYDNIDLDILDSKLSKFIRDKKYLEILEKVIHSRENGLPKGFYTSPWLANFYLSEFDNYVLQTLKPNHYLRYMDNIYLLHSNKRELHYMVDEIESFLKRNLYLELNKSKQVFRMEDFSGGGRAINVVGYVVHRNRVTMRKSILKRARAKAFRMKKSSRCRRIDAATMIAYKGWFDSTDTYSYYQKWIKPNISMRYCRRRISIMAKRQKAA